MIVSAQFFRAQTVRPAVPEQLAKRLRGERIIDVRRRAKNVLIELSSAGVLRVHLRMTGDLRAWPETPPANAATRALFRLKSGKTIVFDDSRALGRIELIESGALAEFDRSLGVEPLSAEFTTRRLAEELAKSRAPVKLFLLDQSRICGLGNIWVAESLHLARIHPVRPASSLTRAEIAKLRTAIRTILNRAVKSAYRSYSLPGATAESEGFGVRVYGREGASCRRCKSVIARIRQGGRSTYFCPGCQPATESGVTQR